METTSFDYTRTQNPLFTKPQTNTYNIVTLYDPHMLNKKNIAIHLNNIHEYLTLSGEFHGFIRTQTNSLSIPEIVFLDIYSEIYKSTLHKTQQTIKLEDEPSIINLKLTYLSDDELKEIIWSKGYVVISYENKIYENIIPNTSEYKQALKSAFVNAVHNYQLPKKKIELFSKQLIKLVIQQTKKNYLDQLIESWNFTEIKLSKIGHHPPIYLNNSLLSEDYTKL